MSEKTILVVDDTPENIDVLVGILGDTYKVKAAVNGMIALKIAEKQLPDLILLDIMMPKMDGYEVCKKLKENMITADIPIVFVTGKSDNVEQTKGMQLGAKGYLTKPVNPEGVLAIVQDILSSK